MSSTSTNEIWKWVRHIGAVCLFGIAIYFLLKLAFPFGVNSGSIDIQLHDTYFIIGYTHAAILITFWSYCLFTFIYQLFIRWRNSIVNWVQLVFWTILTFQWVFTFIFLDPFIEPYLKRIFRKDDGWTIYPPGVTPEPHSEPLQYIFAYWIIASIPFIYLLYCVYRTVKNHRAKN